MLTESLFADECEPFFNSIELRADIDRRWRCRSTSSLPISAPKTIEPSRGIVRTLSAINGSTTDPSHRPGKYFLSAVNLIMGISPAA